MRLVVRVLAMLVVVPAVYFFVFWMPFSLGPLAGHPAVAGTCSILAAAGAGAFVWKALGEAPAGLLSTALLWAAGVGAVGFSAGFFGPLLVSPRANQGPLLGLLITGPLGFVAGAIAGTIRWAVRRKRAGAD